MNASSSISNLMSGNVITADPKDKLAKVIGKMVNSLHHEIPIVGKKNNLLGYFGFDILARKKHIPLYTAVEKLMVTPPKVLEESTILEASKALFETGFRAIPITDKSGILKGIISRTDIIKAIPDLDMNVEDTAGDLMTPGPRVLDLDDSAEDALSLMTEIDEVCAPVVDKKGFIAGGVLIEDISRGIWGLEGGVNIGDVGGENFKAKLRVREFISEVPVVREDEKLKDLCKKMGELNPYICMVSNESHKPIGVITQYDILKKIVVEEPSEGVLVDITGLEISDPFVYSGIVSKIERFVEKVGKFSWIDPINLNLHIETHKKGGRLKWSVKTRLRTNKGMFHVKSFGWNILECIDNVIEELTRKILSLKK
jgi:CBS domain-containing protein